MKFNIFRNIEKSTVPQSLENSGLSPEVLKLARLLHCLSDQGIHLDDIQIPDDENTVIDEFERFRIAESISMAIYPKYKFSEYGRIFLEDKQFIDYYQKFMDPGNWHSLDRKYTLDQFLKIITNLEGDLVECGVYQGASAYLMCQSVIESDKTIHLFDSFEGLSSPGDHDGDYWHAGALQANENILRKNLESFFNFVVYGGWIPTKFDDFPDKKICFLHIDVDLYQPTLDSLNFFYEKIVNGGIILMDDYGFSSCPGARYAADEFFYDKKEEVILLTTGQAFVIRS